MEQKKQRTSSSVDAGSSLGQLSAEAIKACDRLAEFVAKNGRNFEDMTRDRNLGDTPFKFLHEKGCSQYKYYDRKVKEIEAALGKSAVAPVVVPPPTQAPVIKTPHLAPQAPSAPVVSSNLGPSSSGRSSRSSRWDSTPSQQTAEEEELIAKRAAEKGDSVAAMDAYMKLMAKKAAEKEAQEREEEEERKRQIPLLNETSFDRRKVTAVFKTDGTRGHHMSDFIPPEELARLLAKGGDEAAKAAAIALEQKNAIQSDNIGHKLLSKMGWKEGQGLGKDGITAPVAASSMRQDNLGLGAEAHGEVKEGDDPFEQYRKRMMLGYKYRPNPLGNPRKAYY